MSSTSKDNSSQLAQIATLGGEKFKDLFFAIFDAQREEVSNLYRDQSILIWNGHRKTGVNEIKTLNKALPSSKHDIKSTDAQPIFFNVESKNQQMTTTSILVIVTGDVKWGMDSSVQGFHHTFVLERDPMQKGNFYYISSHVVRSSLAST